MTLLDIIVAGLLALACGGAGFMFGHRLGVEYAARFERAIARKLVWQVMRENIENPSVPRDQAAAIRRACLTVVEQLSD